ncbi:unnamed protein product [Camellia sinensis]
MAMRIVWSSTRTKWVSLSGLLLLHLAAGQLQDGLLDNGDFETPPAGGFSNLGLGGRGDGPTAIPSWKTNGTVVTEMRESRSSLGSWYLRRKGRRRSRTNRRRRRDRDLQSSCSEASRLASPIRSTE